MSKFWEDRKDIKITISEALAQFSRRDDLVGWVRPNQNANVPALADEIARLSKENAELRITLGNKSEVTFHGLTYEEMKGQLRRKGVLDFVRSNIESLMGTVTRRSTELDTLLFLRLMHQPVLGFDRWTPTEDGYAFLNRLSVEMAAELARESE